MLLEFEIIFHLLLLVLLVLFKTFNKKNLFKKINFLLINGILLYIFNSNNKTFLLFLLEIINNNNIEIKPLTKKSL